MEVALDHEASEQVRVATGRFAVPLPAGWSDRTVVTLAGSADAPGDGAPNVVVTRETLCDHMGLGAFADGWVARLREEVPVTERRPVEHGTVAGRRAQIRSVSWEAAGLALTQLCALVVQGDDGYAIVCTAPTASFERHEPTFRTVIDGFRFADPPEA